ncbi:MAG: hypothetical protein CBC48_16760 [bacterium TMED88]|nr:hypothetical protein [Deltaproteobacteria bacterium]OUV25190.1 MAG: hypothetical protein CBC48_16760 [bacterium TMED88]
MEGKALRESMMRSRPADPSGVVMSLSNRPSPSQKFDTALKLGLFEIIADRLNISSESVGSRRTPRTV